MQNNTGTVNQNTNCNNTTEVGNNYVVDKLIEQSKAAAVAHELKGRMATIYGENQVKLRNANEEIESLLKRDEKREAELDNIHALCMDAGVSHENNPPVQNVVDLVKEFQKQYTEIARLKEKSKTIEDMHEHIRFLLHMKPNEMGIGSRIQSLTDSVKNRAVEAQELKENNSKLEDAFQRLSNECVRRVNNEKAKASKLNA